MKPIFRPLLLAAAVLACGAAYSHGPDKAKHGGVVRAASDLSFTVK